MYDPDSYAFKAYIRFTIGGPKTPDEKHCLAYEVPHQAVRTVKVALATPYGCRRHPAKSIDDWVAGTFHFWPGIPQLLY